MFPEVYQGMNKSMWGKRINDVNQTVTKTIAKEFATHKSHRLHASEGFPLL